MDDLKIDRLLGHTRDTASCPTDYYVINSLFCVYLYNFYKYNGKNDSARILLAYDRHFTDTTATYLVIPITCEFSGRAKHINYETDYSVQTMRHWILAIVNRKTKMIFMYDSLNMNDVQVFWGGLIKNLMEWKERGSKYDTRTFQIESGAHQCGSVNCGYFVGLYFHLHTINVMHSNVESYRNVCCEDFVETKYKPAILGKLNF